MSSRRSRRRAPRHSIWLRIVAGFTLAMMTSWSSLAWALPCCGHEDEAPAPHAAPASDAPRDGDCEGDCEGGCGDGGDAPCRCPADAGPCCGTMPPPALVPLVVPSLSYLAAWIDLPLPDLEQASPEGTTLDVLHVPKG